MPELTIFTAPKPFTNPHIAMIQRNAIHSWLSLGAEVEVILLGQEEGLADFAAECAAAGLPLKHLPEVARNAGARRWSARCLTWPASTAAVLCWPVSTRISC